MSSTMGEHRDPGRCFLVGDQRGDLPELRWEYGCVILLGSRVARLDLHGSHAVEARG
ncbi:hypothetical protein ACI79C_23750 [Geodermatophilus sp. SYSU D00697]